MYIYIHVYTHINTYIGVFDIVGSCETVAHHVRMKWQILAWFVGSNRWQDLQPVISVFIRKAY